MRFARHTYEVSAQVMFTRSECDFLILRAGTHYDFHCRSVAMPGRGAFLNHLRNLFHIRDTDMALIALTLSDLDTLVKILEPQPGEVESSTAAGMRQSVINVLHGVNGEAARLNRPKQR